MIQGQWEVAKVNTDAKLTKALDLHRAGKVGEAVAIYDRVLKAEPNHGKALGLRGLAAYQEGALEQAVALTRRSIEIVGEIPFLMNNLGLALADQGQYAAAAEAYRRGLAQNPEDPDLWNNLSNALQVIGAWQEALEASEHAVRLAPDHPQYQHNRGVLLQETGSVEEALSAYEIALENQPTPETYNSLASALDVLGYRDAAIRSYERALELDPLHEGTLVGLRWIFWDAGHPEAMEDVHRRICASLPDSATAFRQFGETLIEFGKYEAAEGQLTEAVRLDPDDAHAQQQLAIALMRLGRLDEALEHSAAATRLVDDDALIHETHGEVLFKAGRLADSVESFIVADQRPGRRSSVLANLTIAMNELGDSRIADLVDYERFVTDRFIDVPAGFVDLHSFNETLHADLAQRHIERPPPIGQTMQGGTQIRDNLFANPSGPTALLRQQIAAAIRAYLSTLERDPEHPFLRNVRPDFRFAGAWSTILGGDGYDGNHIHNEGWLSGVYYVRVPELDEEEWERGEGCIQFGEPPLPFVSERNCSQRRIRPEPGKLVFFPSYYWHGVRPFHRRDQRHSIAFDVM